jgi:hypothetical protein
VSAWKRDALDLLSELSPGFAGVPGWRSPVAQPLPVVQRVDERTGVDSKRRDAARPSAFHSGLADDDQPALSEGALAVVGKSTNMKGLDCVIRPSAEDDQDVASTSTSLSRPTIGATARYVYCCWLAARRSQAVSTASQYSISRNRAVVSMIADRALVGVHCSAVMR